MHKSELKHQRRCRPVLSVWSGGQAIYWLPLNQTQKESKAWPLKVPEIQRPHSMGPTTIVEAMLTSSTLRFPLASVDDLDLQMVVLACRDELT